LKVRDRDPRPAGLGFEWSASKARLNAEKHGVTFDEAATAFRDPLARIFDDPVHSSGGNCWSDTLDGRGWSS
jgi:uncharacterized DUF497 family protein